MERPADVWDDPTPIEDDDDDMEDAPKDMASNWLSPIEGVEPEELGVAGDRWQAPLSPEDREDNGQAGPTQENGGLGLGDEEGLGLHGLTEAGVMGSRDHDAGGALDRLLQRETGPLDDVDDEDEAERPRREPELRRDRLDSMLPPMYAEPNDLDAERDDFEE
ncbi:MAG: hypothetical protein JST30_10460 [Armatimonadetes bacterium]|nr:hypothetical protein [Armatimonadota bacterium]